MRTLSICIVNWNSGDFLLNCLSSIKEKLLDLNYEVIVVDNASCDDSVKKIQINYPWVNLILNGVNKGFAAANNIAIDHSVGKYILLLNPDTFLYDNAIGKMIKFIENNQHVGCCGPRLVHPIRGVI